MYKLILRLSFFADTVDENDSSADEDEEITDGEDQDQDGAERKDEGGDTGDKEEAVEGSEGEENGGGEEEEEEADDPINSGVTRPKKNPSLATPSTDVVIKRPRKNRKKRLNETDREFCRYLLLLCLCWKRASLITLYFQYVT